MTRFVSSPIPLNGSTPDLAAAVEREFRRLGGQLWDGLPFFDITPAEQTALITPTDYRYVPGNAKRYGVTGDGATDDTTAILNWLKVGGSHDLVAPPATYIFSSQLSVVNSGTNIYAYGATFKAKASTDFEKTVYVSALSNVSIRGLTIDVNQANRASSLTQRSVGLWFDGCTDCYGEDCTVLNAIGYTGISGFAFAIGGNSVRCRLINPTAKNCGIAGKAADAIFMSGTQCTVVNPTCVDCLDTGIAIESSQQSGCIGGTILRCGCICAITNATNTVANDNYITGLTGYDWDASVTGGIQLGNPLNTSTGDLLNTRLSDITLHRNAGSGPAINVRQTGSAITKGLTLSNIRVKGASTQALLMQAEDVNIDDCDFDVNAISSAVQLLSGSARINIRHLSLHGTFTVGISSDTVSDVNIIEPIITGDAVNSTFGVFFFNSASNCRVIWPIVTGVTTARVGSDAGTVPTVVSWDESSGSHRMLITKADVKVLTVRQAGYTNAMTGTPNRATAYDTSTITLVQLAERIKAIEDDLLTHGLIGP